MMWLILFALAVAAGIVFSLAAMMLQQRPRIHRRIFGGNRRSGQSDLLHATWRTILVISASIVRTV